MFVLGMTFSITEKEERHNMSVSQENSIEITLDEINEVVQRAKARNKQSARLVTDKILSSIVLPSKGKA